MQELGRDGFEGHVLIVESFVHPQNEADVYAQGGLVLLGSRLSRVFRRFSYSQTLKRTNVLASGAPSLRYSILISTVQL
jgi:hypothetical protein